MHDRTVLVIDYGLGNLFSVLRAIEHCGGVGTLTSDADEIRKAPRLVLPGVGAFQNGMHGLRERGLVEPIREFAATGRPLLGICLGMQMLVDASEEFGFHEGLGLIPGRVIPVEARGTDGQRLKTPHIGWSALHRPSGRSWSGTILDRVPERSSAYFVHSFAVQPRDPADRLADALYGDCRISAAIQRDNVAGCQFHPEKSARNGLRVIQNFLEL